VYDECRKSAFPLSCVSIPSDWIAVILISITLLLFLVPDLWSHRRAHDPELSGRPGLLLLRRKRSSLESQSFSFSLTL
jgi:uncharacterized membrane protein YhaH (DUF805 family)